LECSECGAILPEGSSCEDYFHELLALESTVPGAAGAVPHFLAVASYNLQHPLGFTPAALSGLRRTLADVLAGRARIDDARRRASAGAEGATRVRRRADTALSEEEKALLDAWPRRWPMTVLDVCRVQPEKYAECVRVWATAVATTFGDDTTAR
jgi:hypothetical protein